MEVCTGMKAVYGDDKLRQRKETIKDLARLTPVRLAASDQNVRQF